MKKYIALAVSLLILTIVIYLCWPMSIDPQVYGSHDLEVIDRKDGGLEFACRLNKDKPSHNRVVSFLTNNSDGWERTVMEFRPSLSIKIENQVRLDVLINAIVYINREQKFVKRFPKDKLLTVNTLCGL